MPLSKNELKQIKAKAIKYVADQWEVSENAINLKCTPVKDHYEGYIAGATAQAEKYQSEVGQWEQQLIFAEEIEKQMQVRIEQDIAKLASRNSDIEQWKAAHDNCAAHFDEQSRELRELREIANEMVKALEWYSDTANYLTMDGESRMSNGSLEYRADEALAAYRKIKPEIKP